MRLSSTIRRATCAALAASLTLPSAGLAAPGDTPSVSIDIGEKASDPGTTLTILALLTLITLAPTLLIMMTGFVRILIVLGFLRNALGTQLMPPTQVLVGLSVFLTLFVMTPTMDKVNERALQPYLAEQIAAPQALELAKAPLREFMLRQTRASDLSLFVKLSRKEPPATRAEVPLTTLVPAFMISELKTAFQIGFLIFLPFLVIDLVVSSALMSMGMMMLPPVMISLPFKLLLFVLVDGWALLVESLVAGFHT